MVTTERRTYAVVGASAHVLGMQLDRVGPVRGGRRFAASTEWDLRWSAAPIQVTVGAIVTLPRWSPPRGCAPALICAWTRFLDALEVHERGHLELASGAGRAALEALSNLDPGASTARARAAVQDAVARSRLLELDYDRRTRHGAAQGAVWSDLLRSC